MKAVDQESFKQIFTSARSHNGWAKEPVTDELLKNVYDLMKWAPTSANSSPARIVFVKSATEKEKLLACVAPGNLEKTKAAPVTVIIAQDMEFFEKLPKLMPHIDARAWFVGNQKLIQDTAFRNSSLQGAY